MGAKKNINKGTIWQLFVKKNRFDPIVIMDAKNWFDFYKNYLLYKQFYDDKSKCFKDLGDSQYGN